MKFYSKGLPTLTVLPSTMVHTDFVSVRTRTSDALQPLGEFGVVGRTHIFSHFVGYLSDRPVDTVENTPLDFHFFEGYLEGV